jgi:FKBP-type peptidyl-prolyl cis-trans isomerase SlyD
MKRLLVGITLFGLLLVNVIAVGAQEQVIAKDKTVKIDYTLTVDGKEVDSSAGKQPLEFVSGSGMIIPGLEKQLEGLKVGDEKDVIVLPEEAYGLVNPELFQEADKTIFPKDFKVEVGQVVPLQMNDGKTYPALIAEIKDDKVVLNFNHPLAGKTLEFKIKIVDIK